MFKNYLKTTLRSLARKKGYSFINIAGLTLGLACCLIIFQYVAFEYSFDRFHENERDLYRVIQSTPLPGEDFGSGGAFTGFALAPALEEEVPEIRHAVRLHTEFSAAIVSSVERPERVFEEDRVLYTDPGFLEMFTFPLLAGDPGAVLEPGTILLSESAARKYFGEEDPVGRVLDWTGQVQADYRVAGVFRDVPPHSHLQFDFLLPMDDLLRSDPYTDEPEGGWSWNNFATYVQLHPGAERLAVDRKMTEVYATRRGDMLRQVGRTARMWTQPLREVHLEADIPAPVGVVGSYRTVYFFSVIGLVTLLIALVNYVNLATARALDRAREVGVRKAVGAHRRQLVTQFLVESALTNLIAAALAVLLASALTPVVNELAGTQLTKALWVDPWFWAAFLATFGVCTLLAGLYPAVVLSSFRPVAVLKGRVGSFTGQLWLRRGLVVFQFAVSIVLLGGTVVVYDQLGYMREMDLGLDLEQVLVVDGPRVLPEGADRTALLTTFTQELQRLPGVRQAARSTRVPGRGFNWNGADVRKAADDPASTIRGVVTYADTSFAALYGLELAAGRGFTASTVGESDDESEDESEDAPWSVIANETAVKTLGFATAADAVDQAITIGGYDARIIGVYEDFDWSSAHEARQNVFFGYTDTGGQVSLRVATGDLPGTIASIERVYDRFFPGNVFGYAFADETFDRQYRDDRRFAALFTLFAGLAVVIACLGLFGLASLTTQQRTKEIGVRRVLGATVPGLVALLTRDFLKLVLAAIVIASPVAYLLMQRWLEGFAYRIDIGPGVFVLVGALALGLAFLTVAYQSTRAARTNPARSLRVE